MFNWKKSSRNAKRTNARRASFQLELLEQRKMMTVSAISADSFGKLSISCNDSADNITVYQSGASVMVKSTTPTGGVTTWNMGSTIRNMEIRTAGGDDIVTNNTNLPSNIYGGAGSDQLFGGSSVDWLYGDAGIDTLKGNGGNDVLWGGTEKDMLYGNAGADYLYGEDGDDTMYGGGGDDYLSGGNGLNWMAGDDASGASIVDGVMAGNDQLYGGPSNDTLRGDYGDDRLYGAVGNDYLDGGTGNDKLFGGDGNDSLYGQGGDDFLDSGSRAGEYAEGGSGNDFSAYVTTVGGASNLDIAQGGSNNCFILASMGAAASRGVDMGTRITYAGNGNYNVALFRKSGSSYVATTVSVQFDGTLKTTDPTAHFRGQEGESWTVIMGRALAQLLNINLNTTTGGYSGDVLGAILGRAPSTTTWADKFISPFQPDPLLNYLINVQGAAVTLGTRNSTADVGDARIAANHVYMLHSVQISGYTWFGGMMIPQYQVVLVNPWGVDMTGGGPTSGANDGVVVLTGAEFRSAFDEITLA